MQVGLKYINVWRAFKHALWVFLSLVFALQVRGSVIPDRRPDTTKLDNGSLIFPIYSHVPGIGSTYGVGGLATNLFGTRTDLTSVLSGGDMTTVVLGLTEVHLITDKIVTSYYLYSTKIPFQVYDRGSSSDPNNFFYSVNKEYGGSTEIDFNFWQRRVQFNSQFGASRLTYQTIANPDGVTFAGQDGGEMASFNPTFRLILDFTDDNVDPRKGLKIQMIRDQTLLWDGLHSQYAVHYGIVTAYVPILKSSTWAFNIFRSSAAMQSQNTLSQAQLQSQMNLGCNQFVDPNSKTNCQSIEAERAQERATENQYGTAGMLGGPEALRGFPLNRFHGSQSIFYATELRLNLSDESSKFNFGFVRGTKSVIQLAPFYELGAVSDPPLAIEQAPLRSNYGIGLRFGFSGSIIRADVAFSNEGPQFTFFVGYPWDMSPF